MYIKNENIYNGNVLRTKIEENIKGKIVEDQVGKSFIDHNKIVEGQACKSFGW